ncbi:hypothetical protein CH604_007415 [Haemophilus influenzae]|uniref:hypothetical protein n=1 Tax=Haemophilus influenzae TaxID=727 RepID=UPI001C849264|nr:hypothetical protein [Haemophilus influenzae]
MCSRHQLPSHYKPPTAAEKLAFPTTCGNTKPERALAAAKPRSNLLSNLPILPFNSLKPDWKFYY